MKALIKKGLASLKQKGLFQTIKTGLRFIKYSFVSKNKMGIILDNTVNVENFENIIVFENNFCWDKIMKQRPQQIAEGLPSNTLMFYHSHYDADFTTKNRVRKIKDNLILLDLGYYRNALMEKLKPCQNKFVMIYSTDYIDLERIEMYQKNGYEIIYEYVDDINSDLMGKEMYKLLYARHKKLMIMPNVSVVCTANELKKKLTRESKLITNGVDYAKFEYRQYEIPADLKPIKEKYKTTVCYYGALASWFDYELVCKLAQNKDYAIVLLGVNYDGTLEKSGILKEDNIFYLGKKAYDELPSYGCNMDVLVIPFVINDITNATSPVKIFEYMAMKKPIVTTDLPECRKYKSVLISKTHDEFIENVAKAASIPAGDEYFAVEEAEARENDWSAKAKSLVDYAIEQKYNRISLEVKSIINKSDFDRIVIWRSPFGWDVPLFQRPQHIARQLARKRCLVFYEITLKTDDVPTIKKQENGLYLVNFENPKVHDIVMSEVEKCKKPHYIQIYSTNWSMSLDEMNGYVDRGGTILYEYIDDISPDLAGTEEIPEYIKAKYDYVMSHPEIPVVTTAQKLYEDAVAKRGTENLVLSCNGVDYDFFKRFKKKIKFGAKFTKVINNGKINMCYYGALASWFDYELIKKINDADKYNIILFGIAYDMSFYKSGADKLKNVYYFGPIEYEQLKYYAVKMDILTIPFVINSITLATSPLKLFEYMALQKPIVTTAMDECKKYKSVLVAETHEEFIEKLDKCSELAKDRSYLNLLDKEAKENDWSKKADIIISLLKKNEKQ